MAAAIPLMIAGGAAQAVGSIMGGNAAAAAGNYNSAIATQNVGIAGQEGQIAVAGQQRQGEQSIGNQVAAYGASGVSGSTGSPADMIRQSIAQSSMDAANIRYNYDLKMAGYNQEAAIDKMKGEAAQTSSYYSAAGQLLGSAANVQGALKPPSTTTNNYYSGGIN